MAGRRGQSRSIVADGRRYTRWPRGFCLADRAGRPPRSAWQPQSETKGCERGKPRRARTHGKDGCRVLRCSATVPGPKRRRTRRPLRVCLCRRTFAIGSRGSHPIARLDCHRRTANQRGVRAGLRAPTRARFHHHTGALRNRRAWGTTGGNRSSVLSSR